MTEPTLSIPISEIGQPEERFRTISSMDLDESMYNPELPGVDNGGCETGLNRSGPAFMNYRLKGGTWNPVATDGAIG